MIQDNYFSKNMGQNNKTMSKWKCDMCKFGCHNACEIESCNDIKCCCEKCKLIVKNNEDKSQ